MGFINYIIDNTNKVILYIITLALSLMVVYVSTRMGYKMGLVVAVLPFLVLAVIHLVRNPLHAFFLLFVFNYFVMGLSRYVKIISPGIALDILMIGTIAFFVINALGKDSELKFKDALNSITLLSFIWFLYCMFQIFNPNMSSVVAWMTGVRNLGVYFLVVVVLTSMVLRKFKRLEKFLMIWSILSILAVLKALYQKFVGFDTAELRWLYLEGGSVTHLLYYGIRYFSFFTDAANFGTGIGFSSVVFSLSALFMKNRRLKVYYILVSALCFYGMIISGTRGSLAVPFVGYTLFVFISKKPKYMLLTFMLIASSFIFLKYTHYGNGNTYIRRMRSVFNKDDASLRVRLDNQQRLRTYMWQYPFGIGIAMSRPNATTFEPNPVISKIPSDSWYVRVWMELGIVGLLLHIFILLFILAKGSYIAFFKLKDEQLKGIVVAMLCGLAGVYIAAFSLEIIGQLPTSIIMFICMTIAFISPVIDKELQESKINTT